MAAIAEDSGLGIDALDGAPGVESARFGGARSTYPEKFATLYDMLDARGGRDSAARFVCALAVADGDASSSKRAAPSKAASRPRPAARTASATTRSSSSRPRAARWPKSSDAVKRAVSHRGEAFRQFRAWLENQG